MSAQNKYRAVFTNDQCQDKRLVPFEDKRELDWWEIAAKGVQLIATRMCFKCNRQHEPGEYALTDCQMATPAREPNFKEVFPERVH